MQGWAWQAVVVSGASFLLLGAGMLPGARADDGVPDTLKRRIAELDQDGDGKLSKDEFPYAKEFEEADQDQDGVLSAQEVLRRERLAKAKVALRKDDRIRKRFEKADKDHNGVVSRDEFPAADALFERFDRDGNGEVMWPEALAVAVEEEVAKIFAEHDEDLSGSLVVAELPEKNQDGFYLADANKDGEVTGEEAFQLIYSLRLEVQSAGGSSMSSETAATEDNGDLGALGLVRRGFAQRDTDQDGALSRAEFAGSLTLFSRIDQDSDDKVTQAELRLRLRLGQRLGRRAQELRNLARERGWSEDSLEVVAAEGQALFRACRYEELAELMDEIELELLNTNSTPR